MDLFVGQLKSCLKCQACGYRSTTFEVFCDLFLPIPKKGFAGGKVSLQGSFSLFTREEELESENAPLCDRCRQKTRSTLSTSLSPQAPHLPQRRLFLCLFNRGEGRGEGVVVPPIIFFIKKYPSTWRLPCLPAPYTELPRPLPMYSPRPATVSLFFVNKFIKKKKVNY